MILNNTSIIPFKWQETYKCFYCDLTLADYAKFRKHTKTHGECTGNYIRIGNIKVDVSEIACEICQTEFESLDSILDHLKSQHSKKYNKVDTGIVEYRLRDLKCVWCPEQFSEFKKLVQHMKGSHPKVKKSDTTCQFCLKTFPSTIAMELHLSSCVKNSKDTKTYKFALCNSIRKNIQVVLNTSTAVPFKFKAKFQCFYCSKSFIQSDEVRTHTRSEHPVCDIKSPALRGCKGEKTRVKIDITSLACKICSQPMSDLPTFIDHAIADHEAGYDKSVPIDVCFEPFELIDGSIPCPECRQSFTYFATLLRHMGAEHSHKYVCAYCGRCFRSATSLGMHISNGHTGICECSVCGTKCRNAATLARHMARYHDAKDFKCSQCPEQFETIYKKQKHLIKVHNVGHKCSYCGSMFTKYSFMVNHIRRTHLKERTVPCSVCNLKFFDQYQMKLHMVKHEGERRFKCEVCGKAFLRMKNLRSHMDTHKKGC